MNKILYISGDGIAEPKNKWKNYFNYFDGYSKNYFITKAFKSIVNNIEGEIHDCYINGIQCYAEEHRFGGIVISKKDYS